MFSSVVSLLIVWLLIVWIFCFSIDIDLQRRIVLLSHAIMCAKSSTSRTASAAEGEFLHELEEKMEVSKLMEICLRGDNQSVTAILIKLLTIFFLHFWNCVTSFTVLKCNTTQTTSCFLMAFNPLERVLWGFDTVLNGISFKK